MNYGKSESGQVLVMVLLAMPFIFGILGLAIDVGYLEHVKRQMQTAADAAAMAGAAEIPYVGSDAGVTITSAAQAAAQSNGYASSAITVNNPPTVGPHAGNNNYVEVIVSQSQPTYFTALFGLTTVMVRARAVGYLGSGQSCIYALDPTGTGLRINGTNTVTVSCGVVVDSAQNKALDVNGASGALNTRFLGVVGGANCQSGVCNPPPVTGIPPVPDPLAYLKPPVITASCSGGPTVKISANNATQSVGGGSCDNVTISGQNDNITLTSGSFGSVSIGGSNNTVTLGAGPYGDVTAGGTGNTVTFSAGQYSSVTVNSGSVASFSAGTYVITAGDLSLAGANGTSGAGVTFYLGPNAGTLTLNGLNTNNFAAPTTGAYAGVLFYQDPGDTNGVTMNGSNSAVITGTIYCPTATITLSGANSLAAYAIVVAYDIRMNGNNSFEDNYSSLPGGSPIKTSALVE